MGSGKGSIIKNGEWAEMAEEMPESYATQIGRLGEDVGGGTSMKLFFIQI